ncbi:DUF1540 domain-containing protein [Deinococcus yavapaiensis]|uniref:Uncharacterized protein DUF1540 n=1 Tax=Deinococcus yavapaiensis KR-236 TaxID=694435 RepID=A0A318SDJ0_9DEIO|nr:DUF1540 domain-containing protein [Deinococcus yavapaiensis]PYE54941.1 uncharacterized protein DUF1540 [Deinococcus yavapaiensis KR-236]
MMQDMNRDGQLSVVGQCDVTRCRYNEDHQCHAGQIQVSMSSEGAACMTYTPRDDRGAMSEQLRDNPA